MTSNRDDGFANSVNGSSSATMAESASCDRSPSRPRMIKPISTASKISLVLADVDGTLLH